MRLLSFKEAVCIKPIYEMRVVVSPDSDVIERWNEAAPEGGVIVLKIQINLANWKLEFRDVLRDKKTCYYKLKRNIGGIVDFE
jgi:hypothetical protein